MTRYVTFLRGINVGGRSIKMAELKVAFETLGFKSVITVLQTGNVLFETDKNQATLKALIESQLIKIFHTPVYVQIFTHSQLENIVGECPFASDKTYHSYVIFFEDKLEIELAKEATAVDNKIDVIRAGKGVIYWRVPIGLTLGSTFAAYLTKSKYKQFHTSRNLKTLIKILAR
jgi:uncharacterized protein (DUF1697 family)